MNKRRVLKNISNLFSVGATILIIVHFYLIAFDNNYLYFRYDTLNIPNEAIVTIAIISTFLHAFIIVDALYLCFSKKINTYDAESVRNSFKSVLIFLFFVFNYLGILNSD